MTAAHHPGDGEGQAPPEDPAVLEQEIEQTRQQLGETVAALVAKTDVKARATGKAREMTARLTHRASQAGGQAASRASEARSQLASQGRTLLAARQEAGHRLEGPAARAAAMTGPARQAGQRAVTAVRQHPVPAALVAGALILAILAATRGGRR